MIKTKQINVHFASYITTFTHFELDHMKTHILQMSTRKAKQQTSQQLDKLS